MKNKEERTRRFLEILPGAITWGIIAVFLFLAIVKPVLCAILIIAFDFYWIIRTLYLTILLILAYQKLARQKNRDWLRECQGLSPDKDWSKIYHLVIFPVYKEGLDILKPSLEALRGCRYPKEKLIVVLAFEKRNVQSPETARILELEFGRYFFGYFSSFHPEGIPGETPTKGANATWAAKQAKAFLNKEGIAEENVIVSCFDADTCVDKEYFGCLTHGFLASDKPHQASYQPMPVYNNNIWYAPSFARIVEITSTFCQMIESMRLEKFVTFSSHSMSFKTLVDIDYWPVNMVSDDSVVYWKAFLYFNGDYRVKPLYITVSMDAAYSNNFFKTILIQYKQKRRWAWGVENFPFVVSRFLKDRQIPLAVKIRRSYHLLDSHVTWGVWAVIIMVMPPMPMFLGGAAFAQMSAVGYNLPRITGLLFNFTFIAAIIWIILSHLTLPRRPADVKRSKYIIMIFEWLIVPFNILILGSTPALDAQTRLMLGKYMGFETTEKKRKINAR